MKFNPQQLLLYAVTDCDGIDEPTLYAKVEAALKGGATLVQLRDKHSSGAALLQKAVRLKTLCHGYGVPLIVNDAVDVALQSGADGVHVGAEDEAVAHIRRIAPNGFIIGATCKTVEQAQAAERDGADYMGVGALFPSLTKPNAVRITNERLRAICSSVAIPAVAIGGIGLENIEKIERGCVRGVAVVSAVFDAEDVERSTKELKARAKMLLQ